jgi:hypothetical protein
MTATAAKPEWRIARTAVVVSAPPGVKRSGLARQRARTAVLVAAAVFVGVQLTTHRAIDTETVPLRDPIYGEKVGLLRGHSEFWLSDPLTPSPSPARGEGSRMLAVGSSRTQLALDAARLSDEHRSVFNFGCAGCGPVTVALYLRRLIDDGVAIDEALVELHPAMLADMTPPFESRWLHDYRLRRHEPDTLREYGWPIDTPTQFRPEGPLQATHTFRFAALNAYAPVLLPCPFGLGLLNRTDDRGHVPGIEITPEKRAMLLAQARMEYDPAFADYRPGGPAVMAVRDMLSQLQSRGVHARLLLTPESSEFRSWYGPGGQERITAFAAELANEFGVPLIDAREWIADADFADGHHCTPAGTAAFTDRLREVLK